MYPSCSPGVQASKGGDLHSQLWDFFLNLPEWFQIVPLTYHAYLGTDKYTSHVLIQRAMKTLQLVLSGPYQYICSYIYQYKCFHVLNIKYNVVHKDTVYGCNICHPHPQNARNPRKWWLKLGLWVALKLFGLGDLSLKNEARFAVVSDIGHWTTEVLIICLGKRSSSLPDK